MTSRCWLLETRLRNSFLVLVGCLSVRASLAPVGFLGLVYRMADNKGPSTKKTAAELDEEIDEFMKERSSGKKREISFKEENWEEVWELKCVHTC